jgi:hypothetical protein
MDHVAGYLSACKLLHAITVIELSGILAIHALMGASLHAHPALMMLGLFPFFTQLDARSRFQEFKQARDQLIRYGPDRRIFKSLAGSRCQRDAVLAASKQLGHERDCREYFLAAGYRWYHLLPDFVKDHPDFLIYAAFWRTTFFAPTYRTRMRVSLTGENQRV